VIVYPAIDIRGGRCVRLVEGDFARETSYDADPATAARRWAEAGAKWLHVVDLDGAVAGKPVNQSAISRIRQAVDIPIQLGGGLRSMADLDAAFSLGIDRAILGTAALRDQELIERAVARWGEAIAVALDARDGRLSTDGWLGQTEVLAVDAATQLERLGVRHFIFTDISRDGTLRGPNLAILQEIIRALDAADVVASGGIAAIDDIRQAAVAGARGAIVGRALYDGRIDLSEAISAGQALEVGQ
jgi:phosphoribosylformimino-5-aminoimidazole carboxamide ribotide isomerase